MDQGLVNKRHSAIIRVQNLLALAQRARTDARLLPELQARYEDLPTAVNAFESFHLELLATVSSSEMEAQDEVQTNFDSLHYSIKSIYREIFGDPISVASDFNRSNHSLNSSRERSSRDNIKLPRIEIPKFDGNIKGWPTFYDVFRTLIHENTGLTDIERFQYLVASLSQDALTVVKNLPITEDNYKIAYAALVARYQNKRVLLTNYWQSIVHAPTNKDESASMLRSLLSTFAENLTALDQFGDDMWDFTKFNLLLQKIDSNTRKRFELDVTGTEVPKYDTLYQFLQKQCHALEAAGMSSPGNASNHSSQHKGKKSDPGQSKTSTPKSTVTLVTSPEKTTYTCAYCSQEHSIFNCNGFLQLDTSARHKYIKDNALCFNCFAQSHSGNRCPSKNSCQKCDKRHHTLLHFATPAGSAKGESPSTASSISDAPVPAMTTTLSPGTILFQTALICIRDAHGNSHHCRALLDSASGASFIRSDLVSQLGLPTSQPTTRPIRGLAQMSMSAELSTVQCTVTSRAPSSAPITLEMIVIPNICDHLPTSRVRVSDWKGLRSLSLADPGFSHPGAIDLMLGADVYSKLVKEEIKRVNHGELTAINTIFGWVITGTATASPNHEINAFSTFVHHTLDDTVKQFWELDQVPQPLSLSADDQRCAALYDESCVRVAPNRYIVALPFRDDSPSFGDSYHIALRRFASLENRLKRDPQLHAQYASFMQDYLDQGHMRLVSSTDIRSEDVFYIPHHCVFKTPGDPATIRVLFDGSAKSSNGVSLNSTLYTGPKLQRDIASVLLAFRIHKIAFTADIRQMYRQIQISDVHQNYQRILWRFSPREPIRHYQLTTVTYGVSSSPYLAIRTLFQLCDDEGTRYPLAAQVLRTDTYVDDIVSGAESPEQALELQQQLIALTGEGGFELRKWASSHPTFLSSIPADHQQPYTFGSIESAPLKILGLQWRPDSDTFSYQVDPIERLCTKRTVLSDLARVYDPLGFLTPITLFAKHLMQCLWSRGLQWDEPPPPEIVEIWSRYTAQLSSLSALQLPRRVICDSSLATELHGFCDASENGYAAVTYLRQVASTGEVHVSFLCAKSRVSPLNRVSIPRLELCAAVLLADLIEFILHTYEGRLTLDATYAWSDSTVALSWIQSSPHRWKTFVANRVSHIQARVPPSAWNHVDGVDNPADCASRGLLPDALPEHPLWWAGPSWLQSSPQYWPQSNRVLELPQAADMEQRQIVLLTHATDTSIIGGLLERYSSIRKIMGIVAFCYRFKTNCAKSKDTRRFGTLSEAELYHAQTIIIRDMQRDVFSEELQNLRRSKPCAKPIRKLAPFLDTHGVIRVGGRLRHSELEFDAKHPMLLPRAHRLTELIIRDVHENNLHPGPRTLHYLVSQRFWILSPRRAINHTISKCFRCARVNPTAIVPKMSDLPPTRVSQVKPFSHTGIDFAGPFTITMAKSRGAKSMKAYVCVFVCFATKAMHLELVSDLSSEACLAAMRRFVARRGRCSHIYSDCGTNFVGVNRTLLSFCKDAAESSAIAWHFNPPASPHFGGLWEAGVKSVKTHLKRVVGLQCLTYEELLTVLTQIEAVLNSRPLCPMSDSPNDVSVLTPGHFLTLEPLNAPPDPDLTPLNVGRLNRWQLVQRIQQDFWHRWHVEYLHTLQQRGKWTTNSTPPTEGALVLLKDENVTPLQWAMGRIIKFYPSRDGIPRVAQVRTRKGVLDRPLVKLCPLPSQ